jgi:hypothetical protein
VGERAGQRAFEVGAPQLTSTDFAGVAPGERGSRAHPTPASPSHSKTNPVSREARRRLA